MPLVCEFQHNGEWHELNQIIPGDHPASISDWNVFGGRQIYVLLCELDDSRSVILRSLSGTDAELPAGLSQVSSEKFELVREIYDGEDYERKFFTDRDIAPRLLRFRHVTIKFGTRKCLLCGGEYAAPMLGRHTLEHGDALTEWPGGVRALIEFYRTSIKESVALAEGFPRVQHQLESSLTLISELQMMVSSGLN